VVNPEQTEVNMPKVPEDTIPAPQSVPSRSAPIELPAGVVADLVHAAARVEVEVAALREAREALVEALRDPK
jgi:hypothetical protein